MLFRNCLIGSVVFHLAFLAGVGLWRTNIAPTKPEETYLQIYSEPVARGKNLNNVTLAAPAMPPAGLQKPEALTKELSGVVQPIHSQSKIAVKQVTVPPDAGPTVQHAAPPVAPVTIGAGTSVKENPTAVTSPELSGAGQTAGKANAAPNHGGVSSLPATNSGPPGGAHGGPGAAGQVGTGHDPDLNFARNAAADLPVADTRPVRIYAPVWDYPLQARRNNWEGTTVLGLVVRSNGRVGDAWVIDSSGYDLLDREAVRTVRKWRYRPATREGRPVDCQVNLPFVFKLEE